jgi:hypothetical protein
MMFGGGKDDRVAALERAIKKLGDAQRDQATTVHARLGELDQRLAHAASAKDVRALVDALKALERKIDDVEERRLHDAGVAGRRRLDEKRLAKRLAQVAASDQPILIGPWTGEVGFELLYWIPFVRWMCETWSLAPERLAVMSRGGVESWYRVPAARYVDVFSVVSPDEFRQAVAQEKLKQRRVGAFDQRLTDAALARLAMPTAEVLHPSLMYRMFMPFWREELGPARVESFTRFASLMVPDEPLPLVLPSDYVAVRFYFSDAFPDSRSNRAFARDVVAVLAAQTAVVLLNPQVAADDHADWTPAVRDRVVTIGAGVPAARNLAAQTRVIAGARAFVGTYGGYSYLAPLVGVPALAFYSERTFKRHHLHMAERVFDRLGRATVMAVDVAHAPVVQLALGAIAGAQP